MSCEIKNGLIDQQEFFVEENIGNTKYRASVPSTMLPSKASIAFINGYLKNEHFVPTSVSEQKKSLEEKRNLIEKFRIENAVHRKSSTDAFWTAFILIILVAVVAAVFSPYAAIAFILVFAFLCDWRKESKLSDENQSFAKKYEGYITTDTSTYNENNQANIGKLRSFFIDGGYGKMCGNCEVPKNVKDELESLHERYNRLFWIKNSK